MYSVSFRIPVIALGRQLYVHGSFLSPQVLAKGQQIIVYDKTWTTVSSQFAEVLDNSFTQRQEESYDWSLL